MEILRVILQKVDTFSVLRRYFLIFAVFSTVFLLSGVNSLTWGNGFRPPSKKAVPPAKPSDKTEVSLPDRLKLEPAPESWGLPISGSWGEVHYNKQNQRTLLIRLNLKGLLPKHEYILSLNGKPWHTSNKNFPQSYGEERYYDFERVTTNDRGDVEKYLTLDLSSGQYNVKFFVKDPANNWKIVLYNDFFIFTIR